MSSPENAPSNKWRNRAAAALFLILLAKEAVGSTPTVHVRAERAELIGQLDEQIANGELRGEELYVETFITDHIARDGGSGLAGLAPDDVRDLSPAGVQPWLAGTEYDPAVGANVTESGNTVTVDPAGDGQVISIAFSDELFGTFELDEAADAALSRQGYPYQVSMDDPRQG